MDHPSTLNAESRGLALMSPVRFYALAAAIVFAWILFQLGWMTAHVFSATRFLLYDQGSYLYAVGRWQAGETLYLDFAWQYGPLSLIWYRGFAALGGNSPLTLVIASSCAFAIAWMIVARLAVRSAGWAWGGGLALAGLLPIMSASGPNAINGPHGAIEMLLLALIAWTLSLKSSARSPWWLGALAGLLQWVRFGPHAMALTAIVIIFAWQRWRQAGDGKTFVRAMAGDTLRLLAGYALCIAPLVVWFFATLPAVGAWEMLWPAHMVAVYAATFPNRWPQISSIQEFGTTWLPALLGVGLALTSALGRFSPTATKSAPPPEPALTGLIFFPLYYALSCVGLFHNDYAIIGYVWLAWPGLALGARLTRGWLRALVVIAVTPALLASARSLWTAAQTEQAWQARPMTLPNGQSLWFRPAEANHFGKLRAAFGPTSSGQRVAVFLGGGGIHHFFQTQRVGRHWWFLPGFVRPWETASAQQALLRHEMILVVDVGQVPTAPVRPGVLPLWIPLPKELAEELLPHLKNPRHIDGVGDLLDVAP
jgi:hypothetical protein